MTDEARIMVMKVVVVVSTASATAESGQQVEIRMIERV
jgi:hypothetical protein